VFGEPLVALSTSLILAAAALSLSTAVCLSSHSVFIHQGAFVGLVPVINPTDETSSMIDDWHNTMEIDEMVVMFGTVARVSGGCL